MVTAKAVRACLDHEVDTLLLVGGVAANSRVRALAEERCATAGIRLRVPPMRLCTDNGAMIAAIGDLVLRAGMPPAPLSLAADSSAPLTAALIQ